MANLADGEDGGAVRPADFKNLLFITASLGLLLAVALFAWFLAAQWDHPDLAKVTFEHFQAIVGLPSAATAAVVIVALFRATEGQIKFGVPGFRFEGASGPIVMWVLCFLSITAAIKLLW